MAETIALPRTVATQLVVPENIEAECLVLGQMLVNNEMIDLIGDVLKAADFQIPVHQRIFAAIQQHYATKGAVTPVLLKTVFESDPELASLGGAGYLARLTGDPSSLLPFLDNAKHLGELARRRRMMEGLVTAAQACSDAEASFEEIMAHADSALGGDTETAIHQPTGGQCFDEMIEALGKERTGVTCGKIPDLDHLMGPLRPKSLAILAARPGMGKTALALSYSLGAARNGHGVLFVSLEMSSHELGERMAADMCFTDDGHGVPYSAIRDGRLNDWQQRQIVRAGSFMHSMPFTVVDTGSLSVGKLAMLVRRHARRMEARGQKLELVVIDYLQLLRADGKHRSNYEAVSEISRSLKAIAKDHGVAIVALAQLSREVEKRADKRPQLADLRDSGQIEQDADTVLFLLREEYYLAQTEPDQFSADRAKWEAAMDMARGRIEFILAKRRNGTTGKAIGQFHGAYQAVR